MAGAVSRSLTAPLDRLKIMLQVRELQLLRDLPFSCVYTGTGFPLELENLEIWEGIFQSGKS